MASYKRYYSPTDFLSVKEGLGMGMELPPERFKIWLEKLSKEVPLKLPSLSNSMAHEYVRETQEKNFYPVYSGYLSQFHIIETKPSGLSATSSIHDTAYYAEARWKEKWKTGEERWYEHTTNETDVWPGHLLSMGEILFEPRSLPKWQMYEELTGRYTDEKGNTSNVVSKEKEMSFKTQTLYANKGYQGSKRFTQTRTTIDKGARTARLREVSFKSRRK